MTTPQEIYVSTDVESDGPIPGEYSMLSFGSVALLSDKTVVDTFSANLELLPEASQDPDTMQWWQGQPEAWAECRRDLQTPETAMKAYVQWLNDLPARPVFVGYPASFDFMFICWYLNRFAGENPFSYVALDMKTLAFTLLGLDFHQVYKSTMPKRWFDENVKSHVALSDAHEQGMLFCNMLADRNKLHRIT